MSSGGLHIGQGSRGGVVWDCCKTWTEPNSGESDEKNEMEMEIEIMSWFLGIEVP